MISVVALALLQLAMPARPAVTRAPDDAKVAVAATDGSKQTPRNAATSEASNEASNERSNEQSGAAVVTNASASAPDAPDQAAQADHAADATNDSPVAHAASSEVASTEAAGTEIASADVVADNSSGTTAMIVRPMPASEASSAPGSSAAAEPFSSSVAPAPAPILSTAQEAEQAERLRQWQERQKRIWLALSVAQSSAATFDAYSTRMVVGSGRGYEMNPMLRPFAGNASMYLAIQAGPVLLDYLSRRMIESHHSWMRRGWWVPQVTGTFVSLLSGARNTALYGASQ